MAMNDVALTSAMRSNLLTLQTTQSSLDTIQQRLATGRKVNSALDGPQAFFAAQSLSNRAKDLARLLDGIGQNISTIKEADKGVTSLTKLVEQAEAVANQALSAASDAANAKATVTGTVSLTGVQDVTKLVGVDVSGSAVPKLNFSVTDADGQAVTLSDLDAGGALKAGDVQVAGTIEQFVSDINSLTDTATGAQAIQASLDDQGRLQITSLTGGKLRVVFDNDTNGTDHDLATALGFRDVTQSYASGTYDVGTASTETFEVAVTALPTPTLISQSFRTGAGSTIATASTKLTELTDSSGVALLTATTAADINDNKLQISVNGGTAVDLTADLDIVNGATDSVTTGTTIQHVVDKINTTESLKNLIQASYDSTTGQLSIRAVSTEVSTIQLGLNVNEPANDDITTLTADLGFGTSAISATITGDTTNSDTVFSFQSFLLGSASGELARLEKDFNSVRTQIDQLVQDTGYAGINLLNGDSLTTIFNETRTTSLTTEGKTFTSAGLGVNAANFGSSTSIGTSLTELRSALSEVRNFGSTLANDLSVIQIRQEFTKETISTLNEGSDKLTLADQNEEGANMLALQTRQQLGVISLSLASQASQSVLRLF